ncbi:alanine--tRNA ligase [Candidatus Woesearchaeota archaeon]|nr:alanine--tRNA ligase [Candidatus Woesearchaeota archaeon]
MLTKDGIKKTFQSDPDKYWKVDLFEEKGHVRKKCPSCGKYFWTIDPDRKTCADASCVDYGFIEKPITKDKWDYVETWKLFEKYFEDNGHTSVPRYPVIDRWRPDLFFTIASIQDFQRLDQGNMLFQYPANPLVVPQVCLRFGDIDNVGVTGRHLTSFVMAGQHAFNHPNEEGAYFKDKCIDHNFTFLTERMGIPEEELVYTEDIWAMPDFSAFGPCMETFSQGLELVNSVFMQFQKNQGEDTFRELDIKVIDVGWGHERLVWFSNGTPSSYDSLFGPVTSNLKKKTNIKIDQSVFTRYSKLAGSLDVDEGNDLDLIRKGIADKLGVKVSVLRDEIEPLQGMYAIADHARTLLFATADGGIPSNVGGGYNLRVVLRRAFNFIRKYDFDVDMGDVAEQHAKYLKPMFPELYENIDNVRKVFDVELEKYNATVTKTRGIIKNLIKKGDKIDNKKMATLYESQGISPEMIREVDKSVQIPSDFYAELTSKHQAKEIKEEKKMDVDLEGIPKTEKRYYRDWKDIDMESEVLAIRGKYLILRDTKFYPEMGGQPHDLGTINDIPVTNVIFTQGVVLHEVEDTSGFNEGELVEGKINLERRKQHTQHHTGTHLIGGAARELFGSHVWQAGSAFDTTKARFDITHFETPTQEELDKIEKRANELIEKKIRVDKRFMDRGEAEKNYGFIIYQGGAPVGSRLRIVKIGDFDVAACGGTHVNNTEEIVKVKISKAYKIQDGVIRIEFACGKAADKLEKEETSQLENIAKELGVPKNKIVEKAKDVFEKWKTARKAIKKGKKVKKTDIELSKPVRLKAVEGDILSDAAQILKTQPKYIVKTVQKFNKELDEMIKQLREKDLLE